MWQHPYNVCLLIWDAKLEMSHVYQSNKIKSYRGRSDRLSASIVAVQMVSVEYLMAFLSFPQNILVRSIVVTSVISHSPPLTGQL